MKRILLTALCMASAISINAQIINGLSYGVGYTNGEIVAVLGNPDSCENRGNTVTYAYGECRYTFDSGRFVDAKIVDGKCDVSIPSGTFRVGDNLSSLIAVRADLKTVGFPEGLCRLECVGEDGRTVQMFVKYDKDKTINEISSFAIAGKKTRPATGDARFFNSVQSIETPNVKFSAGDKLDVILSYQLDVEFSSYGNGICLVCNKQLHEQYLIHYDLNLIIKEILPVMDTAPVQNKSNLRLPRYNRY